MGGVYEAKLAEALPEGSPSVAAYLRRAIAIDPLNGWAHWLLSKENLRLAQLAGDRAQAQRKAGAQAQAAGDETRAIACRLAEKEETQKRDDLTSAAEALAYLGCRSFTGVGCYEQLASIYLRQERASEAERYLQIIARLKPDDVEVIERLGLIKLNAQKWDDLREICDRIIRRHPYSANAYFYKAYIARQETNRDEFYLNVGEAYLMMKQNTGKIFFDPQELERIVERARMFEAAPPKPKAG
jgi:tetratricopeptide (TPR) repeat protein